MTVSDHRADAPVLRIEGVGRRFGALWALREVGMEVLPGERRAILGPNGAGKTTLFNVVAGDYRVTTGRIYLFGEDVTRLPAHLRTRRGLSRTYQNALLLAGLSVADNLYLAVLGTQKGRFGFIRPGISDGHRKRAAEIAARVDLQDVMDVPAGSLGHGQQRHLEVGMALAGDPRLVMLDEPAAGLSPEERADLADLIGEIPSDVTVLLIEHDVDLALGIADRVTVMHHGSVLEEGPPEQIQASKTVQDIYLGRANVGG